MDASVAQSAHSRQQIYLAPSPPSDDPYICHAGAGAGAGAVSVRGNSTMSPTDRHRPPDSMDGETCETPMSPDDTEPWPDHSPESSHKTGKRRRVVRDPDQKYECDWKGCDKKYSRAEHLNRHKQNHDPKSIYPCQHCERFFVRQDLLTRHMQRHRTNKDGRVRDTKSKYDPAIAVTPESVRAHSRAKRNELRRDITIELSSTKSDHQYPSFRQPRDSSDDSPAAVRHHTITVSTSVDTDPASNLLRANIRPVQTAPAGLDASRLQNQWMTPSDGGGEQPGRLQTDVRHDSASTIEDQDVPTMQAHADTSPQVLMHHPGSFPQAESEKCFGKFNPSYEHHPQMHPPLVYCDTPTAHDNTYLVTLDSSDNTRIFPESSAYNIPQGLILGALDPRQVLPDQQTPLLSAVDSNGNRPGFPLVAEQHVFIQSPRHDHHQTYQAAPVFNRGVYGVENFPNLMSYIFGQSNGDIHDVADIFQQEYYQEQYPEPDLSHVIRSSELRLDLTAADVTPEIHENKYSKKALPQFFENYMYEDRRKPAIEFMIEHFRDDTRPDVTEQRERVLSGEHTAPFHPLSIQMLQVYLSNFWSHVHQQIPILHRPTFSSTTCPNMLLYALLALGAAVLDKTWSEEIRQKSQDFANFLAWHTRDHIFRESESHPPAKLWILQTLILLETFEKLYSTSKVHDRADIHHTATLQLMRRGSSLVGRYQMDIENSCLRNDRTKDPPGPNGSVNAAGYNTNNTEYNSWISNEAIRRVGYAAFILDTTHAAMFGHQAVLMPHEMITDLPCSEAMWAATSMADVHRISGELSEYGYKQVTFHDALKFTLEQKPVLTFTFGRVAIIAGLMSVAMHLKQRYVRISYSGVGQKDSSDWQTMVGQAYDFWKQDFDTWLSSPELECIKSHFHQRCAPEGVDQDNVFESRDVLHNLAHMALYCDIGDCKIVAGAQRVLVVPMLESNRKGARHRILKWAKTPEARTAVFHALQFLRSVLVPDYVHSYNAVPYAARDDFLFNRPWAVYMAAMVVWTYGFAIDGAIPANHVPRLDTFEKCEAEMQYFLIRMAAAESPEALQDIKVKNGCLGLLEVLVDTFKHARWELLHEAADLLRNCAALLRSERQWSGSDRQST